MGLPLKNWVIPLKNTSLPLKNFFKIKASPPKNSIFLYSTPKEIRGEGFVRIFNVIADLRLNRFLYRGDLTGRFLAQQVLGCGFLLYFRGLVNSFNRLYWEWGEGDSIATHHPTQGKQVAIVSYRTRYKNQDLGGCWEHLKKIADQEEVPFPVV